MRDLLCRAGAAAAERLFLEMRNALCIHTFIQLFLIQVQGLFYTIRGEREGKLFSHILIAHNY